ncbi:amidohydrolase family protein [Nitrosophilus labii]|uniref:amidohydrolase family protein n=1 Tax=Nitrosophilus labii TaxID=2706014 RepID=UPI0016573044|nr:amidohydrolase family protein [Nitrosophilus labii]
MVIKNAKIVDIHGTYESDVLVKNKKIEKIGNNLKDDEIYDANGAYLLPGLVDLNVKFCDDKVNVQNIRKLSKDALNGGVTTVVLNPDLNPALDNEIILEFIKSENEFKNFCEILPMIKATMGDDSQSMSEIAILLKKGAVAPFFYSDIDSFLICRIFEYAKMYNVPLHCRARNASIKSVGVMHEGEISSRLGLGGINEMEEVSEVAKIIEFAKYYDVEVVFKSLSVSRSIELIKKAKEEGIRVYAEVSIHHLLKTDKECEGYNTTAKIDPPLRDEKNHQKLLKHLKEGDIDFLTSLHSPKSTVQKDISFDEAAFGVDAIGDYLQTLYKTLVESKILTFSQLLKLICQNPAKILGKENGEIKEGFEDSLILFNKKEVKKIL